MANTENIFFWRESRGHSLGIARGRFPSTAVDLLARIVLIVMFGSNYMMYIYMGYGSTAGVISWR